MKLGLVAFGLLCVFGRKVFGRALRDRIATQKDAPVRPFEILYLGAGILMVLFGLAWLLGVIA